MKNNLDEEDFGDSVSILDTSSNVPRNYDRYEDCVQEIEKQNDQTIFDKSSDEDEEASEDMHGYAALKDDEFGSFVGFEVELSEVSNQLAEKESTESQMSETSVVNISAAASNVDNITQPEDSSVPSENRTSIPPLTKG